MNRDRSELCSCDAVVEDMNGDGFIGGMTFGALNDSDYELQMLLDYVK